MKLLTSLVFGVVATGITGCTSTRSPDQQKIVDQCKQKYGFLKGTESSSFSDFNRCVNEGKAKHAEQEAVAITVGFIKQCQLMGFEQGTTKLAECVLTLETNSKQLEQQRALAEQIRKDLAIQQLNSIGATLVQQGQPKQIVPPVASPTPSNTRCTSRWNSYTKSWDLICRDGL